MRISGPQEIAKQRDFMDYYDEKAVSHTMADFGFFPRELLDPLGKHIFEGGNMISVVKNKEFKRLLVSTYYFNNQLVWDHESRNDGYYMDLHGNHIYFNINFAETLGEENVVSFGMLDRKTVPTALQNFARSARRGAKAANKEMSRVTEEFYKLPIGVAHRVHSEYRAFFKEACKCLALHDYHELHAEESFFARSASAPVGGVFMRDKGVSVGKIWFSHQGYTYNAARPGLITLDIMFEDPKVAAVINEMASETYRWITLNDLNVVECGKEQIIRKLQGNEEELEYGCPNVNGFGYLL